jgi:hypothetical protein
MANPVVFEEVKDFISVHGFQDSSLKIPGTVYLFPDNCRVAGTRVVAVN